MVKVLVLYVFHKFNDSVDNFFKHCIFEDENIDFLIIANDIKYNFNLPKYVMTMVRKNVGRDFGGWSEGLLKDQLYKKYDKFIFANSTIMGPFIQDNTRWTDYYINGLHDNIKLFGSTINNAYHSHVQTYIFSLDKEALTYLIKMGKFSITKYPQQARDAQNNEILMSLTFPLSLSLFETQTHHSTFNIQNSSFNIRVACTSSVCLLGLHLLARSSSSSSKSAD